MCCLADLCEHGAACAEALVEVEGAEKGLEAVGEKFVCLRGVCAPRRTARPRWTAQSKGAETKAPRKMRKVCVVYQRGAMAGQVALISGGEEHLLGFRLGLGLGVGLGLGLGL